MIAMAEKKTSLAAEPDTTTEGTEGTGVRVKNPHPAPSAPMPTHQRIKRDGTKIGPIKRPKKPASSDGPPDASA